MANSPASSSTHLILSLALPFGAAMVFAVLGFLVPVAPMDPQIVFAFLVAAAVAGIVGPGIGKMLRAKSTAQDFNTYLQQSLVPTLVSLALREAGVVFAALYVHFGGVLLRGLGVAAVIILTMLLDVRTPNRLRAEYEMLTGRRDQT